MHSDFYIFWGQYYNKLCGTYHAKTPRGFMSSWQKHTNGALCIALEQRAFTEAIKNALKGRFK